MSQSLFFVFFFPSEKEMPQICSFLQNYLETGLDTNDEWWETAQLGGAVSRLCQEVVGNGCFGEFCAW